MTAKELIRRMRESGTGKEKLDVLRTLAGLDVPNAGPDLLELKRKIREDSEFDGPLTHAKEIAAWIQQDAHEAHRDRRPPVLSEGTAAKVLQIVRDGEYIPPSAAAAADFPEDDPDGDEPVKPMPRQRKRQGELVVPPLPPE